MRKPFAIAFAAVVVSAMLVWAALAILTAGDRLKAAGSIGKVRTIGTSGDTTFMVVDFNLTNDSDRDMIVRGIESSVDAADGSVIMGGGVAAADVAAVFRVYPLLGEQYNPIMKDRDTIAAHHTVDRMVGIRLDAPFEKVETRKRVTLRIVDVAGPVIQLTK